MAFALKKVFRQLDSVYNKATKVKITDKDKLVFFSDLHMGNGGKNDDFLSNSDLFLDTLRNYYYPSDYSLVLNGDIEELQRYSLEKIKKRWKEVFNVFQKFNAKERFYKTIGNHDILLLGTKKNEYDLPVKESFIFQYKNNDIFVFHGHQASKRYQEYNKLVGYSLKYIANPLRIKNYSVAHDSRKKYRIEQKAYQYSSFRKIASIIGHTHRPLFESLAKVERLKFLIEQLCREYADPKTKNKNKIKKSIKAFRKELKKIHKKRIDLPQRDSIYNTLFNIPCLFNSGCVVGKRGMTCLEIEGGRIRLVHWFDKNANKKYLKYSGYESDKLEGTDFYRVVLNEEPLDYIFSRINLLS
jgi:UDP-2,3-diacylglucosamine pyrophosphatase LpxH